MNIAIGIGTLLLGGWVLNTPANDDQTTTSPQSPSAESALPPGARALRGMGEESKGKGDRGASQGQGSSTPRTDDQSNGRGQLKWVLPAPPTEPGVSRIGSRFAMPTPPTGVGTDTEYRDPSYSPNPSGSPMQTGMPEVPTSRQVAPPRNGSSPSYYDERTFYRGSDLRDSYSGFVLPAAPTKPFANVRPFASGVSPYMGLFRNDTAGGTIDNYSTLVRPALDQRSMNQQFNLDLYGLERNARLQNMTLQQMDRYNQNSRDPQSISTPQFYRNFGGYYPGLNPMQNGYGQ